MLAKAIQQIIDEKDHSPTKHEDIDVLYLVLRQLNESNKDSAIIPRDCTATVIKYLSPAVRVLSKGFGYTNRFNLIKLELKQGQEQV